MHTSYAMMAKRVTQPAEDEGAEVDGEVEVGGATVLVRGCLERSCAVLRLTVVTSMAHMNMKWGDLG